MLNDNKKKMKILQVDDVDIIGSAFNGHNLQVSLNKMGIDVTHAVKNKLGNEKTTYRLGTETSYYYDNYIYNLEKELSMNNLLGIWDRYLENSEQFQNANIIHYHKLHAGIMSLLRYPKLFKAKPTIWTIHDPWAFTGHCIHPLECNNWRVKCDKCPRLLDHFPLKQDKTSDLWEIKKNVYKNLDIDIVVSSDFMIDLIKNSPLTSHFEKIHKISFGVQLNLYNKKAKEENRIRWNIKEDDVIIGFRVEDYFLKGCSYIYEAIKNIAVENIVILTVGYGKLPDNIRKKFRTIELGWLSDEQTISNFFSSCDIFIMPSLAESFGLMAIEAMASECVVIVFEKTVLENLVFAPDVGIAVAYKSSEAIRNEIIRLVKNPIEVKKRGIKARKIAEKYYDFNDYVLKHLELYNEIYYRQKIF